jgi:hypothetical protein
MLRDLMGDFPIGNFQNRRCPLSHIGFWRMVSLLFKLGSLLSP